MRLPIPGPSDVVGAVRDLAAAAAVLGRAASAALVLLPRIEESAGGLLTGATSTLARVDGLLDRADAAITRLEVTAGDADRLVGQAEPVIGDIERTVRADRPGDRRARERPSTASTRWSTARRQTVDRIDPVVTRAEQTVERIDPVIDRASADRRADRPRHHRAPSRPSSASTRS